jgi:hypothetical protein
MKRAISVKANVKALNRENRQEFQKTLLAGRRMIGESDSESCRSGTLFSPEGPISPVSASFVCDLSRLWTGRLSWYRNHQNDEHREALIADALRYTGLHLENDLISSAYWSKAPLARRVALLLFLVDRNVVTRVARQGRMAYEASPEASSWVVSQPSLASYLVPTLEFIAAIQSDGLRRSRRSQV